MESIGQALSVILKDYWDVLVAVGIFTIVIFDLRYSIRFLENKLNSEISRLREYVDIKDNHLYQSIDDIKKSINEIGIRMDENAKNTSSDLRDLARRMDKFFDRN